MRPFARTDRTRRSAPGACVVRTLLAPIASLLLGAGTGWADAQPAPPVGSGARVRVSHDDKCCRSPQAGSLVAVTPESVVVRVGGAAEGPRVAIARANVRRLDLGYNAGTHLWTGVKIGALAGVIGGAAAGFLTDCEDDDLCDSFRPLFAAVGAGVFGLAGTAVGAIIGSSLRRENWVPIPMPAEFGVAPDGRGGLAAGIALRL